MGGIFIDVINWFFKALGAVFSWLFGLLPDSPFKSFRNDPPEGLNIGWITWFIPFPTMLAHFVIFLGVLATYYVVRVAARWAKVVRS